MKNFRLNLNEKRVNRWARSKKRASLVPAAAVIPALQAYVRIVAVKKLVVEEMKVGFYVYKREAARKRRGKRVREARLLMWFWKSQRRENCRLSKTGIFDWVERLHRRSPENFFRWENGEIRFFTWGDCGLTRARLRLGSWKFAVFRKQCPHFTLNKW